MAPSVIFQVRKTGRWSVKALVYLGKGHISRNRNANGQGRYLGHFHPDETGVATQAPCDVFLVMRLGLSDIDAVLERWLEYGDKLAARRGNARELDSDFVKQAKAAPLRITRQASGSLCALHPPRPRPGPGVSRQPLVDLEVEARGGFPWGDTWCTLLAVHGAGRLKAGLDATLELKDQLCALRLVVRSGPGQTFPKTKQLLPRVEPMAAATWIGT